MRGVKTTKLRHINIYRFVYGHTPQTSHQNGLYICNMMYILHWISMDTWSWRWHVGQHGPMAIKSKRINNKSSANRTLRTEFLAQFIGERPYRHALSPVSRNQQIPRNTASPSPSLFIINKFQRAPLDDSLFGFDWSWSFGQTNNKTRNNETKHKLTSRWPKILAILGKCDIRIKACRWKWKRVKRVRVFECSSVQAQIPKIPSFQSSKHKQRGLNQKCWLVFKTTRETIGLIEKLISFSEKL